MMNENGKRWPNGNIKQGGIANDAMRRDRPRLMLSPADYLIGLTAINRAVQAGVTRLHDCSGRIDEPRLFFQWSGW